MDFLALNKSTYLRERFDQAHVLVKVNNRLDILSKVCVEAECMVSNSFMSIIGVEGSCDIDSYVKGKEKMNSTGEICSM